MSMFVVSPIRWGILGCGSIAAQLAQALSRCEGAQLFAAGSRSEEKAQAFAAAFGCSRAYASYERLASDPDVDVIYVATPHPLHASHAQLCLRGGKAVVCEKPFTLNSGQARELVAEARRRGLFLMEAMWTRFFPIFTLLRRLLAERAVGRLRMISADFGFAAKYDPSSRLYDPALGGGSLLDVGVYCVSLASLALGEPTEVQALADFAPTGVDAQSAYLLGYPEGQIAVLSSAISTQTPSEAIILGETGRIRIHAPFWKPSRLTLTRYGKHEETFDLTYEGNGYQYEVEEVCSCLREGRLESEAMPLDESVRIMQTMDIIREKMGLRYPQEL